MKKVAHIAPPLGRGGGPSGYLYELKQAAAGDDRVLFPPPAPKSAPPPPRPGERLRRLMGKAKRAVLGKPSFYRPPDEAMKRPEGHVHRMMLEQRGSSVNEAAESLRQALQHGEVGAFFCHDPFCAEEVLEKRAAGQQIWLFVHSPVPFVLYHAWVFGCPEKPWEELMTYPDLRAWTEFEIEIWNKVDRVVFPSREAAEAWSVFHPGFRPFAEKAFFLLSGAIAPKANPGLRADLEKQWDLPAGVPAGLFLGSAQPYRGLDALLASLEHLSGSPKEGVIAIAGPPAESLPSHPRLRRLGRVSAVGNLLERVSFVLNLNLFSLFDLSLIEACDCAKPLLLHDVGGNRTFPLLGAGCRMLSSIEPRAVAAAIDAMFRLPPGELAQLGTASLKCYRAHLTLESLWKRHLDFYEKMLN